FLMKKLIGTAMLAALLATSAFAELSISGGATQLWSPIAYNGGDVMTGSQSPWGGGRTASIGFTWVSEDEKAGSAFTFVYNPWAGDKGIAPDGNRIIWVKPWDFLKLTLGHWDGINDITTPNTSSWYPWIRPGTWFAGDSHLYLENEHTGAMIEITPIDDLMIRVGLPFGDATYDKVTRYSDKDGKTEDVIYEKNGSANDIAYRMFEQLHAEVEYTIADILGLKLAWVGGANNRDAAFSGAGYKNADDKFVNVGEIDVYANLLAVENLQLEVGARINLLNADEVSKLYAADITANKDPRDVASALIGLKAGYNITDRFSVKADFSVLTYKKGDIDSVTFKHKPDFQFGVGVGVGLTDSLSLDADFRGVLKGDYEADGYTTDGGDPTFSFMVGLTYACSTNASVGIGFQGKTNGGKIGPLEERSDNFGFAVPILVNVSF
ncbi:MAG: hypothetical protein K2I95_07075, partial [Treponemataceae bacterium]|nr:hypothetical protein [Treponemataceae bacterium]